MLFGEQLRELRKKRGMTQKQLATRAKVSREAIGNYETGERTTPPIDIAKRLADALGVSVDYLLGKRSNRIAEVREKKGISQQQLADMIDVSVDDLAACEAGLKAASMSLVKKIAEVLGVSQMDIVLTDVVAEELMAFRGKMAEVAEALESREKRMIENEAAAAKGLPNYPLEDTSLTDGFDAREKYIQELLLTATPPVICFSSMAIMSKYLMLDGKERTLADDMIMYLFDQCAKKEKVPPKVITVDLGGHGELVNPRRKPE